jgi:regulator of RNase E activity RraA
LSGKGGRGSYAADFADLSTPLVADACVRRGVAVRTAPPGIAPVAVDAGIRVAGPALPARHYGSVDVFLEALGAAEAGDVLVIDNGGRTDEACIGDLVALEAQAVGLAGVVVWGLHRDTGELLQIPVPVFSYGAYAVGPLQVDPRDPDALLRVRFGSELITREDVVFADVDGVLFVAAADVDDVLATARELYEVERGQAERIRRGEALRAQTEFDRYLRERADDPSLTFRRHLRRVGGAIEE